MSACLSIWLSVCFLSICRDVYSSVCLSVFCLSLYSSVRLQIRFTYLENPLIDEAIIILLQSEQRNLMRMRKREIVQTQKIYPIVIVAQSLEFAKR